MTASADSGAICRLLDHLRNGEARRDLNLRLVEALGGEVTRHKRGWRMRNAPWLPYDTSRWQCLPNYCSDPGDAISLAAHHGCDLDFIAAALGSEPSGEPWWNVQRVFAQRVVIALLTALSALSQPEQSA